MKLARRGFLRRALQACATIPGVLSTQPTQAATWQSIAGSGGFSAGPSNGRVTAISALCTGMTSVLLRSDGKVAGVGLNTRGVLGSVTPTSYSQLSALVGGLSNVQAVSCARGHVLALLDNGTVYATGNNDDGQLGTTGTADTSDHPTPAQVLGLTNVVAVSAGGDDSGDSFSYFLKSDGTVWACGAASYGRLGSGRSAGTYGSPVQITELSRIVAVAAGGYQGVFLRSDGAVYGVGFGTDGRLGGTTHLSTATQIATLSTYPIVDISAGLSHNLFLSADGKVYGLGSNQHGRLGLGSTTDKSVASAMTGITTAVCIAAGARHSVVLDSDGTVWACGDNQFGALGDGTVTTRSSCVKMLWQEDVVSVAAGSHFTLLLGSDGNVKAAGLNGNYQLGDDSTTSRTVAVSLKTRWT